MFFSSMVVSYSRFLRHSTYNQCRSPEVITVTEDTMMKNRSNILQGSINLLCVSP